MIKKLQRKFIIIMMVSLLLIMLLLIGSINIINFYRMDSEINGVLELLVNNKGKFPKYEKENPPKGGNALFSFQMNEETQFETRYFVVLMDENGESGQINTGNIKAVSSEEARDYAAKVMKSDKESGYEGIYKYKVVEQPNGYMIIFMDCRTHLQTAVTILIISCVVALATLVFMFILVSVFSKKAIKPFIENAEKQKLFITDAGHEIKTPLAIISANTDVLELTGGKNEWITSIRNQTVRLDKLVKNLLILAKMDEENIKVTFTEFDFSETVLKIAGSFAAMAETSHKKFQMEVKQGVTLFGDKSSMEQLISTLVDNAIKYSNKEGIIRISLSVVKKRVKLEVYNTADQLDVKNLDKLFDRFYRADSSRSRETGGYGIGLSIARSIVEAHHGKISVRSDDGKSICFTVII